MLPETVAGLLLLSASFLINYGDSLTVTEPSSSTIWHLHSPNVVQWQSVSTDPESIEIRIVNNNPSAFATGFTRTIKDGINTADNKFSIDALPGIKPGRGYQVNIMSSAGTILAQSAQFSINGTVENNTTTSAAHPNTQPIAQPPLSAPASPSPASTSDAAALKANWISKFTSVTLMTLVVIVTSKVELF